jgi:hypothetical protein
MIRLPARSAIRAGTVAVRRESKLVDIDALRVGARPARYVADEYRRLLVTLNDKPEASHRSVLRTLTMHHRARLLPSRQPTAQRVAKERASPTRCSACSSRLGAGCATRAIRRSGSPVPLRSGAHGRERADRDGALRAAGTRRPRALRLQARPLLGARPSRSSPRSATRKKSTLRRGCSLPAGHADSPRPAPAPPGRGRQQVRGRSWSGC